LWTSQRGIQQVVHVCERAAAAGVRAGMTLAHARALLAGVPVHDAPYTPREDAAALRRLARWMLRFAPVVSPDDPDGLMLDIAGSSQLFGGEGEHVRKIADALSRWGLQPRLAAAPTFACAWAVARYGRDRIALIHADAVRNALAPLPVHALRPGARTVETLADVGIQRIEHLLALPRDELAARYGPALLLRLDQATGMARQTLQPIRLLPRYESSHVFDGPVRRIEIIEATTRELLARLLDPLRADDRGILELAVELRRVNLEPETRLLRLTHPNRSHGHLWKLLWPRLEQAHLGFGVEEIILRATRTGRVRSQQAAFLREPAEGASDPAALGELIDRLVDRLGGGAVTRVQPAETYVPERAFVHAAVGEVTAPTLVAPANSRCAPQVYPAHRPSQLFDPPEPARVMSLVPDGPPVWMEWRGQAGAVVAGAGPERIAAPWWEHRLLAGATRSAGATSTEGAAPAVRDYFEVEDEHGRRLWVFRDGASGDWYVHGQWA
jgi:protein ImuB